MVLRAHTRPLAFPAGTLPRSSAKSPRRLASFSSALGWSPGSFCTIRAGTQSSTRGERHAYWHAVAAVIREGGLRPRPWRPR